MGLKVQDSNEAYTASVANGAIGVLAPTLLTDRHSKTTVTISEIQLFGDTVVRFISGDFEGPFLPNYEPVNTPDISYGNDNGLDTYSKCNCILGLTFLSWVTNYSKGIIRLDHCVSNVPKLFPAVDYLFKALGFHEFSEFTAADIGTTIKMIDIFTCEIRNKY